MGLFTEFPLNNIERIEVIRGPGSVLYGTNAFSGVVNIITRKAEEGKALELSGTYGSYNYRQADGRAAYGGEDWSVVAALKKTDIKGESVAMTDEAGVTDFLRSDEGGHGLSVLGNYKNLTVQGFTTHVGQDSMGGTAVFPMDKMDNRRHFLDAGYVQDLGGDWKTQLNVTYNESRYFEQNERLWLGEASVQGSLSDTVSMLAGGTSEDHEGIIGTSEYATNWHSLYGQLDWTPISWVKLVGGAQLNHIEGLESAISPQAAVIVTPFDHWGLKILYGEAFRAATATEAFFSLPEFGISSDPATQPETNATTEAQIFYQDDGLDLSLSIYRSRIKDIIGRIPNPSGPGLLITNTGDQVFEGVELEGKAALGNGWSLQGSTSVQQSESYTNIMNPTFYTNWMAKAGVSYEADSWSFGTFGSYYGDPSTMNEIAPAVRDVNPKPEPYKLVSANISVDLNKALDISTKTGLIFTVHGENLLDEKVYFPEYNRKVINSFPIDSGRAVYGRLTVRF
jgi:outer membrane receptor protein involved in Fe transport